MRKQTVAMYCFLDELLTLTRPVWARPTDPRRRLSDAQVLTTALIAARFFGSNLVLGQRYMEQQWGQKHILYTDTAYTDYALGDLFAEATDGQQ